MNKLTTEMIEYIKKKAELIKFGKIVIELRDNAPIIDIITEERNRFDKK